MSFNNCQEDIIFNWVLALPEQTEGRNVYFVKNGSEVTMYVTDGQGVPYLVGTAGGDITLTSPNGTISINGYEIDIDPTLLQQLSNINLQQVLENGSTGSVNTDIALRRANGSGDYNRMELTATQALIRTPKRGLIADDSGAGHLYFIQDNFRYYLPQVTEDVNLPLSVSVDGGTHLFPDEDGNIDLTGVGGSSTLQQVMENGNTTTLPLNLSNGSGEATQIGMDNDYYFYVANSMLGNYRLKPSESTAESSPLYEMPSESGKLALDGDFIPLSGTTEGNPITGDLRFTENRRIINEDTDGNASLIGLTPFSAELLSTSTSGNTSKINTTSEGATMYSQNIDGNSGLDWSGYGISLANTIAATGKTYGINIGDSNVTISSNDAAFKGLIGGLDYSANNDGSDRKIYPQTGWVQDAIAAALATQTLQDVTDNGNTTTTDINIGYKLTIRDDATGNQDLKLKSYNEGKLVVENSTGLEYQLDSQALTTSRSYTLPDKMGTFAMLSDIPESTGGTVTSVTGVSGETTVDTGTTTPVVGIDPTYTAARNAYADSKVQNTMATPSTTVAPSTTSVKTYIDNADANMAKTNVTNTFTTQQVFQGIITMSANQYLQNVIPSTFMLYTGTTSASAGSIRNTADAITAFFSRNANATSTGDIHGFESNIGGTTATRGGVRKDGRFYGSDATASNDFVTKQQIDAILPLSVSASLDFGATASNTSTDLTVAVTGAILGDIVTLGVPNGSTLTNSSYTAWVSAANTVTVRFNNYSTISQNPASGTFKVRIIR